MNRNGDMEKVDNRRMKNVSNMRELKNESKKIRMREKGSNWKCLKSVVLKSVNGSKRKGSKGLFEERSVKERKKSSLEELLSEGGKDDMSVTPVIGVDCEMVEVVGGESALGRVSVVNYYGYVLYDRFVKPQSKVTDYRTKYSGIRESDLKGDKVVSLREAQNKVAELMKNRIVVGHGLSNDFGVLLLSPPKRLIRDTAYYSPLMYVNGEVFEFMFE